MKKIIGNVLLSILISLPLLPYIPDKPKEHPSGIEPMSYFEDVKELY